MTSHPLDSRVTITGYGAIIEVHPAEVDFYLSQGWTVVE